MVIGVLHITVERVGQELTTLELFPFGCKAGVYMCLKIAVGYASWTGGSRPAMYLLRVL